MHNNDGLDGEVLIGPEGHDVVWGLGLGLHKMLPMPGHRLLYHVGLANESCAGIRIFFVHGVDARAMSLEDTLRTKLGGNNDCTCIVCIVSMMEDVDVDRARPAAPTLFETLI